MKQQKHIVVVGGGAAGFFTAINIAEKHPSYKITILEKTNKLLSKVKVSGGGRCNVTNARSNPSELVHFYPRGHKKLYSVFQQFTTSDMVEWLDNHGVKTHAEEDQRMFPITNSSQTVIDCFVNAAYDLGIKIMQNFPLTGFSYDADRWIIQSNDEVFEADKLIITTGSSPTLWNLLNEFGLKISPPVPSLFTFKIDDQRLESLQGVSFENAEVKVTGSNLVETGPLLITHWGLSGPVVLKLSSWGAIKMSEYNYQFEILVNYVSPATYEETRQFLTQQKSDNPKRKVVNYPVEGLPKRFWERICHHCEVSPDLTFAEISKRQINKLTEELTQGRYQVHGKSTFKEEFVTSGGVELSEIDLKTFQAKRFPNLYLAGEVIDIDALTGGFNFQACWSAGWLISETI